MYTLSTLPKRTTPLIEPSSGQYSLVLACHRKRSRSFANFTMACEHACGSTTGCARGGLLWNKAFVKGASRLRAHAPPVQHLLRGGYKRGPRAFIGGQRHHGRFGTPEEEKEDGRKQLPESQSWRRRFGVCFMLITPGSSRNHPSS